MKKQYCLEWYNKSERDGFKSIGYDCPEQAEKAMKRKIRQKSCAEAYITWNYVGNDIPEGEFGEEHFYKGIRKRSFDVLGSTIFIDNDYIEY